jgi:hypothetical protein
MDLPKQNIIKIIGEDLLVIVGTILLTFISGVIFFWLRLSNWGTATLWALALMAAGYLVGFLFGISAFTDNNLSPCKEPLHFFKPLQFRQLPALRRQL